MQKYLLHLIKHCDELTASNITRVLEAFHCVHFFFRKLCILIRKHNAHYNKLHILIITFSPTRFGAYCAFFKENFFFCALKIIVTFCDYISVQIYAPKKVVLFYMCILLVCSGRNLYPVHIWFFLITFFIPLNFTSRTIKFNSMLLRSRTMHFLLANRMGL